MYRRLELIIQVITKLQCQHHWCGSKCFGERRQTLYHYPNIILGPSYANNCAHGRNARNELRMIAWSGSLVVVRSRQDCRQKAKKQAFSGYT